MGKRSAIPRNVSYDFSTIDLKYKYSLINLDPETSKYFNFNINECDFTRTYRFKTGLYEVEDIHQKA